LAELGSIQQAAWEWVNKNNIPPDFFSGPLCHLPLPKEIERQHESDTLDEVRSLFDAITLAW